MPRLLQGLFAKFSTCAFLSSIRNAALLTCKCQ